MSTTTYLLLLSLWTAIADGGWTFYGPYYDEFRGYSNDGPYSYTNGGIGNNDVVLTNCTYDQIGKSLRYMWILPNFTAATGAILTYINVVNLKTEKQASIHLREGGISSTSVTFNIYTRYGRGAKFQFTIYGHNKNYDNTNIKQENICVSANNG